jgi:hypothetical protein
MDNTGYGTLSATLSGDVPSNPRPATLANSAQQVTKRFVFDYNGTTNDNVYGTYDVHTDE